MAISISRGPIVCMLLLFTNAPMWPTDAQVILPPNPNGGQLTPNQINALLQNLAVPGAPSTIPTSGIQQSIQQLSPSQLSTLLQILGGITSPGTATSSSGPSGPSGPLITLPLNFGTATLPGPGSISSIPAGGIQPLTADQAATILQGLAGSATPGSGPIISTVPAGPMPGPANVMNFGGAAAPGSAAMTGGPGSLQQFTPFAPAPAISTSSQPSSLFSFLTGPGASTNNGVTTAGLSAPAGPAESGVAGTQALFGGSPSGTIAARGSSFAPDSSFIPTFGPSFGPASTGYYSLPSAPIKGYYYMARSAPTRPRYKSGFTGVFRSKKPRNFYHGYD